MIQHSPFIYEIDDRLKSMLSMKMPERAAKMNQSNHLSNMPSMARQTSDPLGRQSNISNMTASTTTASTTTASSSTLKSSKSSRATATRRTLRLSDPMSSYDSIWLYLKDSLIQLFELTDLVTSDPITRAGSTGFVTFTTLAAATSACQLTLCHRSFTLQTKRAPEPSGLLWHNIMVGNKSAATRKFMARLILNFGAVLFAFTVAGFAALGNPNSIGLINAQGEQSKYISWMDLSESQLEYCAAYVPAFLGLGLLLIVPWIFLFVASTYESYKSKVDVEISIFKRYFSYYMAYIFITSITFAFVPVINKLKTQPSEGLSELVADLAVSFSKASGYFITVLILKIFFGTTWELSRPWALLSKSVAQGLLSKNAIGKRHMEMSSMPDPCRYGWIYPQLLVVIAITINYQIIAPFIAPFGLAYFSLALLVYKQQAIYVYVNEYESGGQFLPLLLDRTLHIVSGSQMLLALYLLVSSSSSTSAFTAFVFAAPLPFATIFITRLLQNAYKPMVENLTYDVALHVDHVRRQQDRMSGQIFQQNFSSYRYMQPWLTQLPIHATTLKHTKSGLENRKSEKRRSLRVRRRNESSGSIIQRPHVGSEGSEVGSFDQGDNKTSSSRAGLLVPSLDTDANKVYNMISLSLDSISHGGFSSISICPPLLFVTYAISHIHWVGMGVFRFGDVLGTSCE